MACNHDVKRGLNWFNTIEMGEIDITEYMEASLSQTSNRTVTEMVLISVGMSLYTVFGVLGND